MMLNAFKIYGSLLALVLIVAAQFWPAILYPTGVYLILFLIVAVFDGRSKAEK